MGEKNGERLKFPGSLHNHTDYSNLRLKDSINRISDLIDYAIELGHKGIAITEHDTVSNAIKVENYYNKVKKNNPDFKVIRGNEIYLCRDGLSNENFIKGQDKYYHFILLAKDAVGHKQIRELSSRAWYRSYVSGGQRRVPTYYNDLIEVIKKNPGHIIGLNACLGGYLPSQLLRIRSTPNPLDKRNQEKKLREWILLMKDIFGEDFYFEMQPSNNEEQIYVNKEIIRLSKEYDISYTITTDSHYLSKEDAVVHKAYLNSEEGEREVDSFYATTYLMSHDEIESYFKDYLTEEELEFAYETISYIMDSCEDYTLKKKLKIPALKWREAPDWSEDVYNHYFHLVPSLKIFHKSEEPGDRHLVNILIKKFEEDSRCRSYDIYAELEDNLKITWESSKRNEACWSNYFLNLQKTIDYCWEAGTLVGPSRGSGGGFLLLYLLDIIQLNKVWEKIDLKSWRFLNPERVSVLD